MANRVVITGIGVISPIGSGKKAFCEALLQGRSGVRKIQRFDTAAFRSRIAGEIPEFDLLKFLEPKNAKDLDRMDRFAHLALAATSLAFQDSGIDLDTANRGEIGVALGTGLGGIGSNDFEHMKMYTKGPRFVSPLAIPLIMHNAAASHVSMQFGLRGPNITVATACSASSNAIGHAYRMIKHGYGERMISGGAEAPITPSILAAWSSLRALSIRNDEPETACRPFSRDRDGLVLGEGAGIVLLESLPSAMRRAAPIYGEVVGYAANSDAFHITQPSTEEVAKVMHLALQDAGLPVEVVDYISAHGTGTAINDKVETEAIKRVFGEKSYTIPISSTKSMMGHTMGASGAIQVIASLLAMESGMLPPTINYMVPDPTCDLDYVPNQARPGEIRVAMVNAFAFGGNNAVLMVKKWEGK